MISQREAHDLTRVGSTAGSVYKLLQKPWQVLAAPLSRSFDQTRDGQGPQILWRSRGMEQQQQQTLSAPVGAERACRQGRNASLEQRRRGGEGSEPRPRRRSWGRKRRLSPRLSSSMLKTWPRPYAVAALVSSSEAEPLFPVRPSRSPSKRYNRQGAQTTKGV